MTKFYNIDTNTNLGGENTSDIVVSSQKAIKTYVDNGLDIAEDHRLFIYRSLTGTAAKTSSPYYCTRWDVTDENVTEYFDGMVVCLKIPVAGHGTYGTALQINELGYKPVVYNVNSMISTRYSVGSVIWCVYNATQTATLYINSSSSSTITGCWQVMDYEPQQSDWDQEDSDSPDYVKNRTHYRHNGYVEKDIISSCQVAGNNNVVWVYCEGSALDFFFDDQKADGTYKKFGWIVNGTEFGMFSPVNQHEYNFSSGDPIICDVYVGNEPTSSLTSGMYYIQRSYDSENDIMRLTGYFLGSTGRASIDWSSWLTSSIVVWEDWIYETLDNRYLDVALNDLSDVEISDPIDYEKLRDGDILRYDATKQKWVNSSELNPRLINGYDNAEDGNVIVLNNGSLEFGDVGGAMVVNFSRQLSKAAAYTYVCDTSVGTIIETLESGKLVIGKFAMGNDVYYFLPSTMGETVIERSSINKYVKLQTGKQVNGDVYCMSGYADYDISTGTWSNEYWNYSTIDNIIGNLKDVHYNIPVSDGQVLVYNETDYRWENADVEASNIVVRNWIYQ